MKSRNDDIIVGIDGYLKTENNDYYIDSSSIGSGLKFSDGLLTLTYSNVEYEDNSGYSNGGAAIYIIYNQAIYKSLNIEVFINIRGYYIWRTGVVLPYNTMYKFNNTFYRTSGTSSYAQLGTQSVYSLGPSYPTNIGTYNTPVPNVSLTTYPSYPPGSLQIRVNYGQIRQQFYTIFYRFNSIQ